MFAAAGGHLAVAIFLIDIAPVATAPCVVGGPQKGPNIVCKSSLLYEAGAFRSSYSSGPQNALEWAVYNGHLNMVHVLLESSLRREGFSYTVSMSLAWAAYRGHLDVGRLLLEYGAFVDVNPFGIGSRGPTPLMLAAYSRPVGYGSPPARSWSRYSLSGNLHMASKRSTPLWPRYRHSNRCWCLASGY